MPEAGYPPRVLMVLSNQPDADFLAQVFLRYGIEVLKAAEVAQAVTTALDVGVDLVITERVGGVELLEALRTHDELRFLPVVFVLDGYNADEVDSLIRAGADEYLLRPLDEARVALRVNVLLRVGAERRALLEALSHAREVVHTEGEMAERARRFAEETVASLSTLIVVVDAAGRVHFVNRRAREFLGVAEGTVLPHMRQVLGDDFFEQPEVEGAIAVAAETGETVRLEGLSITGRDGRSIIVDLQIGLVHGTESALTVLALEDVTQRWEAEQELLVEKMKLEDTVNTIGAAVCMVDRQHLVLWHNRTFVEWFGPPGDRTCWQIFKQRALACENCVLEIVFKDAVAASEEWRVAGPYGQVRAYINHITPVRGPRGTVEMALVLTQDVTQQALRIEQLSLLSQLATALEGNLDMHRLLYMVLSMVTAGHALGFNRAFIFLVAPDARTLRGTMALGPSSREEAFRIWAELSARRQTLEDFLHMVDKRVEPREIPLSHLVLPLEYDIRLSDELLARVARTGEPVLVKDAEKHPGVSAGFRQRFGGREFAVVPMTAKGQCVGVIMADNLYNQRSITPQDFELLRMFAQQAALAISNAGAFEKLRDTISELNATRQRLLENERLAAIGKTAAFVAHEIRNPLVTIGGFARLLRKHAHDARRVHEAANIIAAEISRLEAMLKGVMDFARPSTPVFTAEDANAVARKAIERFRPSIADRQITIQTELAADLPPARLDAQQIEQVLLNLLKNSSEAIGGRGGRIKVSSGTDGSRSLVFLSVDDNGGGIPQEILEHVFDPFYTTKRYGSGLGLAVCRGIIAGHAGTLEVLNRPGDGVEMRVALPTAGYGQVTQGPARDRLEA